MNLPVTSTAIPEREGNPDDNRCNMGRSSRDGNLMGFAAEHHASPQNSPRLGGGGGLQTTTNVYTITNEREGFYTNAIQL